MLLPVLALGCAAGLETLQSKGITREALLIGAPLGATREGPAPPAAVPENVLGLTSEMRAFLAANVDAGASEGLRVHQLVGAIIQSATFGLRYDEHTRTAAETFRTRRGNCLSFSVMFVALAREAGLHVQFQEVDIPPDWTLDKDTFVLNRHINVHVSLDPVGSKVVDFNSADFRTNYHMRTISDERALAQFYNNVGFERMQAGDAASALACFRRALDEGDQRFSPAWTNLGTLYSRHGFSDYAEAAYLQALRTDAENLVAMSNLARLYERTGDSGRAADFRAKVIRHRWHNPYYRYELAQEAFAAGELDTSIGHLRYAIRQERNDSRFYLLLSSCYAAKGDERAARRWRERARAADAAQPWRNDSR